MKIQNKKRELLLAGAERALGHTRAWIFTACAFWLASVTAIFTMIDIREFSPGFWAAILVLLASSLAHWLGRLGCDMQYIKKYIECCKNFRDEMTGFEEAATKIQESLDKLSKR